MRLLLVAAADRLAQCGRVDPDADVVLQPLDILAQDVVGERTLELVLDALRLGRARIELRHDDIGHPEHDALGGVLAFRGARRALGGLEHVFNRGGGQSPDGVLRLSPVAVSSLSPSAAASAASVAPPLSLSVSSLALFFRRSAIWSSRHRASTRSLISSSVRSRDGVMPVTSYQT